MDENNVTTTSQENVVDSNTDIRANEGTGADNAQVEGNSTVADNATTENESKSFKVKHLHEEKEIPFDEAPTYIQKGLDYDRVKTKYEESKPVLGFVERLAQQNGMTVPEYLKAVEEYERQQEIENLSQNNGLSEELAEELYLSRQERKQRESERQQQENQQRQQQEYIDFLNQFPQVKAEEIPKEVWETKASNPNISLTDAYIRHEYSKLQQKIKAQEVNAENANTSTGSVTGNGTSTGDYISFDTFQKNKTDRNWVIKNLKQITESRSKW